MTGRARDLWRLFGEMFLIAATVLGGGYVILGVADDRLPNRLKGIRKGELIDMLPLFQMVPGIIAGHTAVYVGNRVAGVLGAAVALAGTVIPSVVAFTLITVGYGRIPLESPLLSAAFLGVRAALTGVMAEMIVRSWKKSVAGVFGYVVLALALALLLARVSPAKVIVGGMAVGIAAQLIRDRWSPVPNGEGRTVFRSGWLVPLLFAKYGLLAFGGGFVLVPMFLRDFVGASAPYLQLAPPDFANVVALTQMSPGPVAVNCATFFGYRLAGLTGAVVGTFALVLPGAVILLVALRSIERYRTSPIVRGVFLGMRPVTVALLISATVSIAGMSVCPVGPSGISVSPLALALAVLSAVAVMKRWLKAVPVILLSCLAALTLKLLVP